MQELSNRMEPREFRDQITKANGSVRGIPTQTAQWGRWNP
jgi:hypothetical protein